MNTGSLLDSLLTTNSVSPANKKPTRAQTAASSTEGFQNTLEQLRPKVAVSRPDSRTTQADNRGDSQPVADKKAVKRDLPPDNNTGRMQNRPERSASAPTNVEKSKASAPKEADSLTATGEPLTKDTVEVVQPSNTSQASILSGILAGISIPDIDGDIAQEESPDETLLAEAGLAGLIPASLLSQGLQEEAILPPALANQIATVLNTSSGNAATVSPLSSMATNTLPVGLLNPDAMAEGIELALTQEGEAEPVLAEGELSDNPDLLLLNAKSLLSKLTEAGVNSLDKAGVTADVSKSLTAAAPAIESLSRLSEAQSPAARAFVVQTGVPVALGQPQWGQAVGERVLWLAAQNVSSAEIRLDPPELGPMQVRVSVNQDQVNVSFVSPHLAVRDVLDQQLNRLREMFSEQGLNLGDVDVSDKSFAQQDQEKDGSKQTASSSQLEDEDLAPATSSIIMSNRLVDHYA